MASVAGAACRWRNLCRAAKSLRRRTEVGAACLHCGSDRAYGHGASHGQAFLESCSGYHISSVITLALIASVALLVAAVPAPQGRTDARSWPQVVNFGLPTCLSSLFGTGGLDGGGPTARRQRHEFGSRSFVFPQMQIEKIERGRFECQGWHPHFVDYLFIAWTTSSTFGPTDAPLLARWAKILTMVQIGISLTIVIVLISRAVGVL